MTDRQTDRQLKIKALEKQSKELFEEDQRGYQGILKDIEGLKNDITTQITELFKNQDITTTDKDKIIRGIQDKFFEGLDKNHMDLNSHSKNLHKIEEAKKFLENLREIAINIDNDNLDKIIGGDSIKTIQHKL